jgi:hypothetical protein
MTTEVNPNRLIVDIRPDALVERDINWTKGLRWRQHFVNLAKDRFPIIWLEIAPHASGWRLSPIWSNSQTLVATAPLREIAQRDSAIGAINGGYFNRIKKLPLGAIRRQNQWISGPILNRGAIAWNDNQDFYFGRLTLTENLIIDNQQQIPILFLNSGYVQTGISRYTTDWGSTYSPLTAQETIVVVEKNRITNEVSESKVGINAIPIPKNGYLLVLRGNSRNIASQLTINKMVNIDSSTTPGEFSRYQNIVGAGPLLLQNRQIVLDAKAEKFSDAFIAEKAVRSSICTTADGTVNMTTVHNRVGGLGPTLTENAQLMQIMGCVNALNLDGGSSTSLYLGGELINRFPSTAARVHNGIGIFSGLIP